MMEINYVGFLANVNDSILQVRLKHGYEITPMPISTAYSLVEILEGDVNAGYKLLHLNLHHLKNYPEFDMSNPPLENFNYYYVSKSFIINSIKDRNGIEKIQEEIKKELMPQIALMRLFKAGNVHIPVEYFYSMDEYEPDCHASTHKALVSTPIEIFELVGDEAEELNEFISKIKMPFSSETLKLAHESFEESFDAQNVKLSFLLLLIAIEILLNPGNVELKYRVSRNLAVLIGDGDSEQIYSEMKSLYNMRSKLVHTGKSDKITTEKLFKLRNYVRKSIMSFYNFNLDKDDLLDQLNARGFSSK